MDKDDSCLLRTFDGVHFGGTLVFSNSLKEKSSQRVINVTN